MAAIADVTLKNNAAANVTFGVYSRDENLAQWLESGATSILGSSYLTMTRKVPADKANGVYRIGVKLTRPVINATTGALDGTITGTMEILRPAKVTVAEVDEFYARFKEAAGLAILKTAAESGAIPT